jgi:signal transduction histidine kinase
VTFATLPDRVERTLEQVVLDMAIHFLSFEADEVDGGITLALGELGTSAGVDRVYVFQLTSASEMSNTHEWCRTGVEPMIHHLQDIPVDAYPWFWAQISAKRVIHVAQLDELPAEASADREGLAAQGIRSVAAVPMLEGDDVVGFIGFDAVGAAKSWSEAHLDLLESVSDMFVHALHHKRDWERMTELATSKDEFVAAVSHELRTPLTAVLGLAEEMRDRVDALDEGEIVEFATSIAEQSAEVSGIVEDLLVVARANIGDVTLRPGRVSLTEQVHRVLDVMPGGGTVDAEVSEGWVIADAMRTRQVIRNLVTNALRHGGGRVSITITTASDRVSLRVCDDGPGVPADRIEEIFDPYVRGGGERTQPASIGLGLTVARRLARAMGGDVTYRRGAGSRFELTLPAA